MVLALGLGATGVQGSSVGVYDLAHDIEPDVLIGQPRPVRSDEWQVRTPWLVHQAADGFPAELTSGLGSHDAAVLYDLPTAGWEVGLRPHTAVYHLVGLERAFALEWWLLHVLQISGIYALAIALGVRVPRAAAAGLLVALSPVTQWWTVTITFTIIGYGCLAAAVLVWSSRQSDRRVRLLAGVVAGWLAAAFMVALYPPWQIGVGLVVAGAAGPVLWAARRRVVGVMATATVVAAGLVGAFVASHREALEAIAGTEYPGGRAGVGGGGVAAASLFGAPFDSIVAEPAWALVNGTSQSGNASALVLVVPVALGWMAAQRAPRRDASLVGVLAAAAVCLAWALVALPAVPVLDRVPPERMLLPLALAGALALALVRTLPWFAAVGAAMVLVALQLWALSTFTLDDDPLPMGLALALVAVVGVGVGIALGPRPAPGFVVLVGFALWQAVQVNPLQRGLGPVLAHPVRLAIEEVAATDPEATWVGFAIRPHTSGLLTASGVRHLSAVSPYPDPEAWAVLDPDGEHRDAWNRYAHVEFVVGPVGSEPSFTVLQPDLLVVGIDPCDERLDALGVGYFVVDSAAPVFGDLVASEHLDGCAEVVAELQPGDVRVVIARRVAP